MGKVEIKYADKMLIEGDLISMAVQIEHILKTLNAMVTVKVEPRYPLSDFPEILYDINQPSSD